MANSIHCRCYRSRYQFEPTSSSDLQDLQTPLHVVARQGNAENARLLLRHKAQPNLTAKDLYTPLHLAAREGHVEVVEALLDDGANENLRNKVCGCARQH